MVIFISSLTCVMMGVSKKTLSTVMSSWKRLSASAMSSDRLSARRVRFLLKASTRKCCLSSR